MRRVAVIFAACLSLLPAACAESGPGQAAVSPIEFRTAPLEIVTATGVYPMTVEVAETPAQRERGLMYRTEMAADAGMIFNYHTDQRVAIWMKNTVLPLDLLFINADGSVFDVVKGAVPYSLEIIPSGGPVRAVLELNAGTVERLSIRRGDTVRFEAFGNGP